MLDIRFIALTRGKFATVDAQDVEWLSEFEWQAVEDDNGRWYALCKLWVDGMKFTRQMHRMIVLELNPKVYVDHRDRDGLNNRRSNLRRCTPSQNQANKVRQKNSSQQYKGVHWNKKDKRWSAAIRENGRQLHLGNFKDERQAALAYDAAALRIYGEFARINFPKEQTDENAE